MKRGSKIFLIVLFIIVLFVAIYFTFIFKYKCADMECFRSNQLKCNKAKFLRDSEEATWKYEIKGMHKGKCEIDVKVTQIKEGSSDKASLEGKSMKCYLELGNISLPEEDLYKCTGELKEELQNLIIQNLHRYILENLGKIQEGLDQIVR